MLKHKRLRLILAMGAVATLRAYAETIPNYDDPTTFLGPIGKVTVTSNIGDASAYSVTGEAGSKEARVGLTFGWNIGTNQRFKASAEYLWQHIEYGFFSGNTAYWAQQGTVSAAYQYDVASWTYQPQFGFNAYLAHSPSKNIGIETGNFINTSNVIQQFTDNRRATGGHGWGASPTVVITPWQTGKLTGEINYDNIGYDNDFPDNLNTRGFGATIRLNQAITDHIGLNISAARRQPFNNYAAKLTWATLPTCEQWVFGIFGDYTVGHHALPTVYNAGISVDYFFDGRLVQKPALDLKNEAPVELPKPDHLLQWTSVPAVTMPIVLSVKDEEVFIN